MSISAISSPGLTVAPLKGDSEQKTQAAFGDHSFLGALIDIVNPLQHLPVVSSFYREATGDGLSGIANILGGGLFGGPIGAAVSAVNEIVNAQTGSDVTGLLMKEAQAMVEPANESPYQAVATQSPLKPDHGESAWLIALTGTQQSRAEVPNVAPAAMSEKAVEAVHSIERYRDPSLGLKEPAKQQQLLMRLEKIAIDMKA